MDKGVRKMIDKIINFLNSPLFMILSILLAIIIVAYLIYCPPFIVYKNQNYENKK